MEAFGWVLGETQDMPDKKVRLDLWRPLDLPNINKLRKLEYELSRLPREAMAFTIKWAISLFLIIALLTIIIGVDTDFLCIVILMPYILFWIFALFIVPETRRLAERRERILHRARMLVEGGDSVADQIVKFKRPPFDGQEIR